TSFSRSSNKDAGTSEKPMFILGYSFFYGRLRRSYLVRRKPSPYRPPRLDFGLGNGGLSRVAAMTPVGKFMRRKVHAMRKIAMPLHPTTPGLRARRAAAWAVLLSFPLVVSPHAARAETRGYVVSWFATGTHDTNFKENCP